MAAAVVVQCVEPDVCGGSEGDQRIDRRLMVLESISAECGALLTKIQIKQYKGRVTCDLSSLNLPRTLLPS